MQPSEVLRLCIRAGPGCHAALAAAAAHRPSPIPRVQSAGPLLLRVTVEGGGCSGFQYEFAIEGEGVGGLGDTDRLFERDGVRLVCDDISLEFLKGATGARAGLGAGLGRSGGGGVRVRAAALAAASPAHEARSATAPAGT